ncbi:unnamed protein product [Symbiodinium sp. CCMP2456]|nr:unnamed protein product [Symbiodinium sp. CCMP2456]
MRLLVLRLHAFITAFRGDWKALYQVFCFNRYADRDEIRWMCRAAKGLTATTEPMAFTNINPDAAYWETMFRDPPWSYTPAYAGLAGFKLQYVQPDLLHVWHLGTGRDFAASVIVYIIRHKLECRGVFAGTNMKDRLEDATSQLKAFARLHKLPLKMHKLSKSKLALKTRLSYPELKSSGYDTYVVLEWIQDLCSRHSAVLPADICTATWCASHIMSMLHKAGRYLTVDEQRNKEYFGQLFLRSYVSLAHHCLQHHEQLFRLRPKFHMLCHIFRSSLPSRTNPTQYSTWIDEDGLKRLMKVLRMTDARTAPKRLLERYLLGVRSAWGQKS